MTEILAFVLVMITLSSNRFMFIVRLILSGVTAYWFYKLCYPSMYIVAYEQWNWDTVKEWVNNGNAIRGIAFTALFYWGFYIGLRMALKICLNNPLEKTFQKWLKNLDADSVRNLRAVGVKWVRRSVRKGYKIGLLSHKKSEQVTLGEIVSGGYTIFSLVAHFICCWFILALNHSIPIYVLFIIVLIIITIRVIVISFLNPLFESISNTIEHEEGLVQGRKTK